MYHFTLRALLYKVMAMPLLTPELSLSSANGFIFAIGWTLVALVLGKIMPFIVKRTDIAFKKTAHVLMLIPLIMPGC